ncbi:MAG: thermonuclease family protein [Candidatus Berkelbacteria bacterium]|nr:thermonuclease family protein [Candidatus Berkelbacteria bacterium]
MKNRLTKPLLGLILLFFVLFGAVIYRTFGKTTAKDTFAPANIPQSINTPENSVIAEPAPTQTAPEKTTSEAKVLYKVVSVVDGDTIKVSIDGKTETLRLIGIDTPETVDPTKSVQCFGPESSEKARALLSGQEVSLESDPSQGDLDKYNRLLRYVFLGDGTSYNLTMIQEGFAHEYTYKTAYKYQTEYRSAEASAKAAGLGFWAKETCDGDTTKPSKSSSSASSAGTSNANSYPSATKTPPDPACPIKGNINSSNEKIYHIPGGAYYTATVIDESAGERWFCSENEAVAAGWRKSGK